MAKNLVIVESPAKAKTIEGYLGKDYIVKSSFGHVRDLPKGDNAIDIENNFLPTYEISKDKKDVVKELKKLAKEAETIWLATDDDREGEAISWHLFEALDLKEEKIQRIVFHEITKNAITKAITTPRRIDIDLVNAQQARRVLDRLVGFELSPILWKKIKYGLSAGRVQSVTVRLVVEREREITAFQTTPFFKVSAEFLTENTKLVKAELPERFDTKDKALAFLQSCQNQQFSVKNLEKKPATKKPSPPFTTSTLQQEASRKLGFSVSQTMMVAQRLYESGKITYMRTDSVNLSNDAITKAEQEIVSQFGSSYFERRTYKNKASNAQEAHEAIRPTEFSIHSVDGESNEQRLYQLIWKRAIASQMSDAKLERTIVTIGSSTVKQQLKANGEIITFEGFLKVYLASQEEDSTDEEQSGILPPLNIGEDLATNFIKATERFTRAPARYSEASLVKKLEDLGIGRPSTYAPTISTIQKRGYVEKEIREGVERKYEELILSKNEIGSETKTEITGAEKGKLFPTDIALIVNDFLVKHFPNVTDFSFTANIEKQFDEIAKGQVEWVHMMKSFYDVFHQRVEVSAEIDRSEVGTSRELGTDPKTGRTVLIRLGRFGLMAQIGTQEEMGEEKPQYASLRKGQHMETMTLEEALDLFNLPRDVGMYEEKKIRAAIGRFGPYIQHDGKFVSLKEDDPLEIEEERAIELIIQKRKDDAAKLIKTFEEDENLQILNGRWGPYIKHNKDNVKIPKTIEDPTTLTYEDCIKLSEEQKANPKTKKKAPAKKAATTKKATTAKKAPAKKVTTSKDTDSTIKKLTTKK